MWIQTATHGFSEYLGPINFKDPGFMQKNPSPPKILRTSQPEQNLQEKRASMCLAQVDEPE